MSQESAEALRQVKIPEQMKSSQALIDYLVGQTENLRPGQPPLPPAQGIQELGKLVALMLASQVELIAVMGNMTENLKGLSNLGETLKNLIRPQQQPET
ncbi:hypothetical protein I5J36_gp55 [Mycobacterium phage Mendokysei]|uniref:Uncharacterized protein n=1 Tax=Mycobacterium phage Mendokysei TaxID=2099637 RepID=A0A2P1CG90_9CAUD|nr:hypothetical protein I5J36_gp55 [Mycobacterium phage Mendokysei]AVJ50271.1 hypothetical protein SEA_MENDOKYSEI_55 [Mycobacterium phage Mendokysei]